MKTLIAVAAGTLLVTAAAPAAAQPREYNRGYYDCLAGRYDEDAQSRSYRQGCRDAEREQGRGAGGPPPPGPGWGQNGGPGQGGRPGWGQNGGGWNEGPSGGGWGHRPRPPGPVGIPNITGMQAGQFMAAMAGQGYRNVGTDVSGAAIYGYFFNPATRECVQVATVNGRVVNAVPSSNSRCR